MKAGIIKTLTLILVLSFRLSATNEIAESSVVQVRGHYNYPPYEFLDSSGQPAGLNVEFFNAVAKITGLKINLELGPWDEIYQALDSGEIDVLIGMYYSKDRAEKFDFSIPYETVSYSIFTQKNSNISQLEDLHGKNIVLVEGGASINFINDQNLSAEITTVSSSVDALRLLAAGNYDCTLIPNVQGQYNLRKYGFDNLMAVGPLLLPRNASFALKKGNLELLTKMNEGIQTLKQTGQYDRIHIKWIEIYEGRQFVTQQMIRNAVLVGIVVIVLFFITIGGLAVLRKQIIRKTRDLLEEIQERKKVEDALQQANRMQDVIYKIAHAVSGTGNLYDLYTLIRNTLHEVINTRNFYIAFYDSETEMLSFPYFIDEKDDLPEPRTLGLSLTDYILKTGKPVFYKKSDIINLIKQGKINHAGTPSELWLGAPLKVSEEVIGAIVVQSYADDMLYSERDLDILEFVSNKIGNAIHHKQTQEAIIKSEEKYRLLSEQLNEANKMKKLLLDVITHDLKNPAGVINGMSEMLLDEDPDNEGLQLVSESCTNLLSVIENATIMSKVTLGDEIALDQINLVDIIQQVANEFDSSLKTKDMTISLNNSSPVMVKANPIIAEVFKNYISNAIKYSSDGKRIEVEIEKGDGYFNVQYLDFGPTIPEQKRPLIFNRGVQLEKGAKRGRGLGLAIVKRIAEAHGGEVGVLPNLPTGNIFYLRLPAA